MLSGISKNRPVSEIPFEKKNCDSTGATHDELLRWN